MSTFINELYLVVRCQRQYLVKALTLTTVLLKKKKIDQVLSPIRKCNMYFTGVKFKHLVTYLP